MQSPKNSETPGKTKASMWEFLETAKNTFQRKLDSKEGWNEFFKVTAPQTLQYKLKRIDPPIGGEKRVELDHYRRMDGIQDDVERHLGPGGAGRSGLEEVARLLIANLFFFEPHDIEHVNPDDDILEGSIRCRLEHGSTPLRQLFKRKPTFWSASAIRYPVEDSALAWRQISDGLGGKGSTKLHEEEEEDREKEKEEEEKEDIDNEGSIQGQDIGKFILAHSVRGRRGSDRLQIIAVHLSGWTDDTLKIPLRIPISGFPAKMSDLKQRASQRWLR